MILRPVSPDEGVALGDREATYRGALPPGGGDGLLEATKRLKERAAELQEALYAEAKRALLVVLQARDAGGKDGTVRKVFGAFNPAGLHVTSFKAPSADELAHDFLWRVHRAVPRRGTVGVFNRSHYEDVLVARVRGLVPKNVWSARYAHINEFERILTENGVTVLKLFLHVSRKEQLLRFGERLDDPTKQWKVASGDWGDRARWPAFTRAYRDALRKCSTRRAPWYVVPADQKKVRDYLVADVVAGTLERMAPAYPTADEKVLRRARRGR